MNSHHVQFASILLQCRLEGEEDEGEKGTKLLRQNDAPVDVDALDDAQANNAAGLDLLTIIPQFTQPRNNAPRERLTVINPVTMLPDHACKGCINGLYRVYALELGVRDVFATEDIEDHDDDDDEEGGFGFDAGEHQSPILECIEGDARRKGGRVRFHDDTKGSPQAMSTSEFDANSNSYGVKSQLLCKHLKVRVYRPQRCDWGCPLGITLFYLTVYMGDRTFLSGEMEVDQKALGLDIAVQNASGSSGDRVVLLIAVEMSGPACQLSSASSVSASLRGCMTKLLDFLNLNGKMSKRGNGSNSLTSQMRQQDQQQALASQANHHMALLATLVDNSGGLLQDDDDMNLRCTTMLSAEKSASCPSGNRGGSGAIRKKLFTFSLSKGRSVEVLVSPDNVSRQIIEGATNADIIQETAQRLELLSIIEDEMLLPKYSHAPVVGGGRNLSFFARFPWRSYVGGFGVMGAFSLTGRYGRPPAILDLSSFEYCPSSRRRQASVTTASMSLIDSDEFSMMTGGDETSSSTVVSRYTTSLACTSSLVPTLSKSRRDFLSSGSIETSRSRFFQQKKRDKTTMAQQATLRPLLQTIYDPFRIDDNFKDYEADDKNLSDDHIGASACISTDEIAISSNNHTTSEGIVLSQTATRSKSAAMTLSEQGLTAFEPARYLDVGIASEDDVEMHASIGHAGNLDGSIASNKEYTRYLDVGLALNEDLTCEYYNSKLSSLFVDGTVQVSVKTTYKQEPSPHQRRQATPFTLIFMDHSGHIKALQENKKFVRHIMQGSISTREFAYHISVPREEEYFPVLRYKCGTALCPVPIVSLTHS